MRLTAPRPGAPLQSAVDRAHGHGLWLPSLTGDAVTSGGSAPLAATAVSDASTAHTKGAWVEVTAATAAAMSGFTLTLSANTFATNTNTSTLLDVGVGAGGGETVLVADIGIGYQAAAGNVVAPPLHVPVSIAKGTRIAVRCQSVQLSKNVSIFLTPWSHTTTRFSMPTQIVTIGADTSTSHGVGLSVPGGANTKGSWTEITASCPQALQALALCIQATGDNIFSAGTGLIDVGVGGSGGEQTIISNLPVKYDSNEMIAPLVPTLFPVNVPKGTRIAARYQTTTTTVPPDLILLGVPA